MVSSESSSDPAPSAPARVERFGRYELTVELASGGMASVFLARSTGADGFFRLVALKRIHPHLAKQRAFVEMFLDEARIAARIDHPNVCQVLDFGREDGVSFIAMEFLAGETLGKVLGAVVRGRGIEPRTRLPALLATIAAEAAEGLHAAHELRDSRGEPLHVVHRDVSPQNLFLTFDGTVKVVDFGIASARNKVHETETGEVKGKFAYMAPEQMRGEPVDRRADVWALGVVAWEMLTQKRLFRRETQAETIQAVLHTSIAPPSEVRPELPASFDAIVMRALARDLDARYATAHELAVDLARATRALGPPVDRAELAAWMDQLFPDGRARRAALTMQASTMGRTSVPPPRPEPPEGEAPHVLEDGGPTQLAVAAPRRARVGLAVTVLVALAAVLSTGGWWVGLAREPAASGVGVDPPPVVPPVRDVVATPIDPPAPAAEPVPDPRPAPEPLAAATAPRPSRSGTRETRPEPPAEPVAEPAVEPAVDPAPLVPVPSVPAEGTGCLVVAAGIGVRVDDGPVVEGPRRCLRVPSGEHRLVVVGEDGATELATRSFTLSADGTERIVDPR